MALGSFTLSGRFVAFGGAPAAGRVRVDGIPQEFVDADANRVRLGPTLVKLDRVGAFSLTLPTDVTVGQSSTIAFDVSVELQSGELPTTRMYASAAGATARYVYTPNVPPLAPGGISVDTDGVYYYAPGATLGAAQILVDTDGAPYVGAVGAAGSQIHTDTDAALYFT